MSLPSPILDDDFRIRAPRSGKEHLQAWVAREGIELKWEGQPQYKPTKEEQKEVWSGIATVFITMALIGVFSENSSWIIAIPVTFLIAVFACIPYLGYAFIDQHLYYGANEDGVWIANSKGVSFYPMSDLWSFEQSYLNAPAIKATYARHLQKRNWLGRPAIAFKLIHLPNSYHLHQQLVQWHRQHS